jgi:hypothetical protein
MPEAMVKQWEREQVRSKPAKKGVHKDSEPEVEIVTAGAVPTLTQTAANVQPATNTQPVVNVQPSTNIQPDFTIRPTCFQPPGVQPTTDASSQFSIHPATFIQPTTAYNVQPSTPLPQAPVQSQGLPVFNPSITQPYQIPAFPQFPGLVPNFQSYRQPDHNSYMTAMFPQNSSPYTQFGLGFQSLPAYSPHVHPFYPMVGSYQPSEEDHFSMPMPLHSTPPRRHSSHPQKRYTKLPEPHCEQDFVAQQSHLPTPLSSGHSQDRFDKYGPNHAEDDQARFPSLQDWFIGVDNHPQRGIHGEKYAQYSHAFDLRGLETLLDLNGLKPVQLFEEFGIPESTASRLLKFAEEDISSIQASSNTRYR